MHVTSTAAEGVVNADTVFTFTQKGPVVTAHYAGGKVVAGYLVGVMSAEGLRFQYAQLDAEHRLDGGVSTCEISRDPAGKIRLLEHFQWESREGSGTNIFEELPSGG
jgi:hypothetical protein